MRVFNVFNDRVALEDVASDGRATMAKNPYYLNYFLCSLVRPSFVLRDVLCPFVFCTLPACFNVGGLFLLRKDNSYD